MEENAELKQNKLMKAVVEKMDSMHRKVISNLQVWIKEKVLKENRLSMFVFVSMTCLKLELIPNIFAPSFPIQFRNTCVSISMVILCYFLDFCI